ncbi:MAG: glucose 1-dehydrogenase [Chloroflexia bacterium]
METFSLDGKVAVVTGGNQGLGRAFVSVLADAGAKVAIAARNRERSETAVEEIKAEGGQAVVVNVDVTQRDGVERMLDEVTEKLGPVDVLVNNAGVCYHQPAAEVSVEEWEDVFNVNVHGLWNCAQIVGRQMIERRTGVIVNIGSISGFIVNRPQMQPAYNASKAAVHQLTKSLAAEWAPYNVRVNALAPGYTRTDMAPVDRPEFRRYWIEDAPMERCTTPEELAPSLLYLASDASSFVTGAILVVDGGYSLW